MNIRKIKLLLSLSDELNLALIFKESNFCSAGQNHYRNMLHYDNGFNH